MYSESLSDPIENPARRRWAESSAVKLVVLGLMVLVLLIPIVRIAFLVDERQSRQRTVQAEVANLWGQEQTLVGPILRVPYEVFDPKSKTMTRCNAYFLPESVSLDGSLAPQIRYRGIFETVVYEADFHLSGSFTKPTLAQWESQDVTIFWDQATLTVGIPDVRGLPDRPVLHWGDRQLEFEPGPDVETLSAGIHAPLPPFDELGDEEQIPFEFALALRGSQRFAVSPVGKQTRVQLASTWNDPGFDGSHLPSTREVTQEGFTATWEVPYFGRNHAQQWVGSQVGYSHFLGSAFGVELVLPADGYQQTMRSVKYAVLFILLTFVTFFLIEVVSPVRLHPAQYLLVGFALCLFYVMLLALSEHLGFATAYALATAAIVLLIAGYSKSILASTRWALALGTCLTALYAYLYVLLQLEEYALLFGSLGLFAILALIMYLTRHLDWSAMRYRRAAESPSAG